MPDANCMVAAVTEVHPHYHAAADEYNRRLDGGESLVVAGHTLAEAYSVLTRSPTPLRLTGGQAAAILQRSYVSQGEVVALDGSDYIALVLNSPGRDIISGQIYDAIIGACAMKANVDVFLTFNERHFQWLVREGIQVMVPRAEGAQ